MSKIAFQMDTAPTSTPLAMTNAEGRAWLAELGNPFTEEEIAEYERRGAEVTPETRRRRG